MRTDSVTARAKEIKLRGSLDAIKFPAWADTKHDGEYVWVVKDPNKGAYIINKSGLRRFDCSLTRSAESTGSKQFVLLAELCYLEGKAGELYKLLSNKHNEDVLRVYTFDVKEYDGIDVGGSEPLISRLEMLTRMGKRWDGNQITMGRIVEDAEDANDFFNEQVSRGFEGIVVKNLQEPLILGPCFWAKLKNKDQSDFEVAMIDPVKERIEVFVPAPGGGGKFVGVKCSNKEKRTLRANDRVKIEHQGILSGGGLRHPVYKGKA